jgi:hypothetical protein
VFDVAGAPGEIRTPDPQIRSLPGSLSSKAFLRIAPFRGCPNINGLPTQLQNENALEIDNIPGLNASFCIWDCNLMYSRWGSPAFTAVADIKWRHRSELKMLGYCSATASL